jgi:type III secretory pathway lipoprotein EscJ
MGALQAMSPRGRIVLAVSALGIVFVAFMLFRIASSPSYTTLQAGVDPAKTGKITAALDQAGVSYKLENNGTAIAVVSGQESKARVALAGQGLAAGGSQPGYELLDKQKLGSSTFQQQIAYQRALEGQIAQTIGQIDGVSGAQVQLTLPKDDLFADTKQPATAAVLLNADSTALDPAAIRGIASLVSSSVPNLKPSNVTITDGSGSMLWPQDGAGDASGAASKPAAEARYAAAMQSSLGALIARTVGSDKAQVQVHADLDVDKATQEQLQYAKKGTPLETTKETESLKGTGSAGGGTAGAAANLPTYAQNAASAGGNSNYKRTTGKTTFGVDKTVTRKQIAPGAGQQARRRAARRQVGPRRPGHRAQAGRGRRRRHQPQARRHHDPEHGRLRQAQGRPRPGRPARAARLRHPAEVRGHRPGEHPLPLLHDPRPAPSRAGGPADADVADRDRGPPPAGRARAEHGPGPGRGAGRRRPAGGLDRGRPLDGRQPRAGAA